MRIALQTTGKDFTTTEATRDEIMETLELIREVQERLKADESIEELDDTIKHEIRKLDLSAVKLRLIPTKGEHAILDIS